YGGSRGAPAFASLRRPERVPDVGFDSAPVTGRDLDALNAPRSPWTGRGSSASDPTSAGAVQVASVGRGAV
ncbi:MAG TPA: hypothetical protein VGR71_17580, partial [Nitrospira sp.]|nr:hypothetical protein [Nitrospira sp.]